MGDGFVGGDPDAMTGGARTLHIAGGKVEDAGRELTRAMATGSGSAGYADLAAALERLGAAVGTAVEDTGSQAQIAAALAEAAAGDIERATSGAG